jgi:uncharacterized protein (DUF362 family)
MIEGAGGERRVAIVRQSPRYDAKNVSESIRKATRHLGIELERLVRPGDRVLLKPNLIRQSHTRRPAEWEQVVTHGTVIEAVAREVAAALQGRGAITIADGPQTDSDFDAIDARVGLRELSKRIARDFPGVAVSVIDLRRERWKTVGGVVVDRQRMPDAPGGYTEVDLGRASYFHGHDADFYGADYDSAFTQSQHRGDRHAYLLARLALDADVFINLPKLKTHKKVGITASLKNLVGINGDKNYLPHYTMGAPGDGGDEFPRSTTSGRVQSRMIRAFKQMAVAVPAIANTVGPMAKKAGEAVWGRTDQVVRSGNWHGNDTAWRMVLDLNRILLHYDGSGARRREPLRYLSVVDGIIAGDGDGPMEADALAAGVLLVGTNPAAVDLVCASLMGFDWRKLPMVREAFQPHEMPIAGFDPEEVSVVPELGEPILFRPHFGWRGAIEKVHERAG